MLKIIKDVTKDLAKNQKVKAVYLFGSQATGRAGPLSDFDICVIAPGITEKEKGDIRGCGPEKADVVLFDDLPLAIQVRVFREGKLLYVSDKRYIDALAWRTTKEYWDFKPVIKRFIQAYLPGVEYV